MSKDILSRRLQWPQQLGQVREQKTKYDNDHHTHRTPSGNQSTATSLQQSDKPMKNNKILTSFFYYKKVDSGYLQIEDWKFQQINKVVGIVVKATQETLFQQPICPLRDQLDTQMTIQSHNNSPQVVVQPHCQKISHALGNQNDKWPRKPKNQWALLGY